ncbi:MAG: hypothetical protein F4Y75_08980 [Acidimicrobiia bacterium]|nr:hypothetical protein [bacterium]MXZ07611.1 hypothetical protein [Acidimicrobiia bacterium]MCY3580017.1 hypothetical protein [bacterium]MCY3651696.1 hypothetical protein [bacterium]MYD03704.1 hypothetical protein [Acidimicrobiia bacterium]
MSAPKVALIEEFTSAQVDALQKALPDGAMVLTNALGAGTIGQADYLVLRQDSIEEDRLAALSSLKGVVLIDSGGASVSDEVCDSMGVWTEAVLSPGPISVAEHTVMFILALFKRLPTAQRRLMDGVIVDGMEPFVTDQLNYSYNWVGLDLFEAVLGKTVGLVGVGQIGSAAARMLVAFGVDVVYYKRTRFSPEEEAELGIRYLPFDELLAESHCVSLHNKFTPETEKMMGAREFALMPEGSFFVNTARGRLVDEDALMAALHSGHLAGAALDVFWWEPILPDSPLRSTPNLLMTPHTAGTPAGDTVALEMGSAGRVIRRRNGAA